MEFEEKFTLHFATINTSAFSVNSSHIFAFTLHFATINTGFFNPSSFS